MNKKNIPRYIKACLAAAIRNRPRAYLRMLSQSPYTVATLPEYGISMLVDVRDPAISKPILALGEYERCFAARLLDFVTRDTHFLDVGANIGFFSLVVARRAVNGKVWSIEPDPQNIRLLRASVALNGLEETIDVRHQAASNTDGDIFFSTLGYGANLGARFTAKDESTLLERSIPGAPKPVKVRSQSMDAALQGQKVDLVKIDVEGHEPFVLQGMCRILSESRPVVFSEFAPGTIEHISKTDPMEMLRYMQDHGYDVSIVDEDGKTEPLHDGVDGVMLRYKKTQQHHLDLLFTPRELANKAVLPIAASAAQADR